MSSLAAGTANPGKGGVELPLFEAERCGTCRAREVFGVLDPHSLLWKGKWLAPNPPPLNPNLEGWHPMDSCIQRHCMRILDVGPHVPLSLVIGSLILSSHVSLFWYFVCPSVPRSR